MKTKKELTEDQKHCADVLALVFGGHHHIDPKPFGDGVCHNHYGDLSTWDFDRLTQLVLAAHRFAVRVEVFCSGPGMVKVVAHRRKHGDRAELGWARWHPSLDDLKAKAEEAKGWEL